MSFKILKSNAILSPNYYFVFVTCFSHHSGSRKHLGFFFFMCYLLKIYGDVLWFVFISICCVEYSVPCIWQQIFQFGEIFLCGFFDNSLPPVFSVLSFWKDC